MSYDNRYSVLSYELLTHVDLKVFFIYTYEYEY